MTDRKPAKTAAPTLVDAVRADEAGGDAAVFTYTVLIDAAPIARTPRRDGDRRDAPRRRTRLRSGKIVDARGRFVTECIVHDMSATGVQLRLPPGVSLPPSFQVYDDQSGTLQDATVSWQRDGSAGIRFVTRASSPRDRVIAADMRRKYYKLPR